MTECVFCGAVDHDQTSCPMFGKTDAYLKAFAPKADPPPEEPPSSSLTPTQFEELFGEGAEPLLQDVLERPDVFNKDQQDLALAILGGMKSIQGATAEDRSNLNEIAQQIAFLSPHSPKAPAKIPRPAYIHTQAEMENFEDEYQPPPEKRDWPISSDDPEGYQG